MSSDETRPLTQDLGFDPEDEASRPRTDPGDAGPAGTGTTTGASDAAGASGTPPGPLHRRGPAPFALLLGTLGLLLALAVLVGESVDLSPDWSVLGPWAVVAGGLLVVVVGLLGIRSNRTEP
ncbi:hypothetical protein KC207_09940 [Phycicoccus sp. BSK3Z-2]|uniref:Uncharacterized protein n=1 Tax=Phycicoccus avicenniae TaxID=2828860 RepID=A0A941DA38_9MICO|nr:hypothetical protein [Phycicoccus avicenniae]MBR7743610.1 hypothetical protein [Phycicoccus avicenniae]